jgi:hypothetical protein
MKSITFDKDSKEFILKALGKSIDDDGFVVDGSNKKVPSIDGTPFTVDEFAGVVKGSEIYIKSDVVSLIEAIGKIKAEQV